MEPGAAVSAAQRRLRPASMPGERQPYILERKLILLGAWIRPAIGLANLVRGTHPDNRESEFFHSSRRTICGHEHQ